MAQLKDLIVNGPSRFIGDVYATTFTGDLNGNANTATSATTAAALTGKTLVTASALTTSNWPTYKDNHIPTMSFMTYWNGAYSGTSSNLTYCAQGAIIGSNNIGSQSVKYATTSGTCSGNAATATLANEAKNLQNTTPETKDESFFSKIVTEDADMVSFQTLKGNSVVWNQLVNIHSKIDDGGIEQLNFTKGHKYLVFWKQDVDIPSSTRNTLRIDFLYFQRSTENNHPNAGYYNWMFTFEEDSGIHYLAWWVQDCPEGVTPSISNILFYDLTQMFGAGNEPSTYEEFLQRKPFVEDEFAYNEGTIVDNKVEKVKVTGVNLWDEQIRRGNYNSDTGIFISRSSENYYANVNPIKVLGGKDYYHYTSNTGPTSIIDWYDADMNFIGEITIQRNKRIVTSPSNACFANFWMYISSGISLGEKCCINLSDPSINGQYFPYEEHTLDLSWVKEIKDTEGVKLFEDGMRSAGTAFDEAAKGKAIKRIGVMDMGKMTWYKRNDISPSMFASNGIAPNNKIGLCPIAPINKNYYDGTLVDGVLYWMGEYIMMYNSKFTTIDDFVNFVSGTPIYYELAEPIEVELQYGINHTLPVWKDGMMYAESSQSSTPIVCTNAYYTNIRESVKKFIGDADSIYASTSGYNAHGIWNIDISGKASSAITANSAITATYATTAGSAPASDVYAWAKASTKPTYNATEVKLTGYSKNSSYSAISASDTVQAAIGKLEGAISGLEELLASI